MAWDLGLLTTLFGVARDGIGWFYKKFGPKDPVEVLRHRSRWKVEFEDHYERLKDNEVIIRDVARIDSYPEVEENPKGISPWFKTEFKGLYHRGVEVILRIETSGISTKQRAGPSAGMMMRGL